MQKKGSGIKKCRTCRGTGYVSTNYFKRRRQYLMDKHPYCYWCEVKLVEHPGRGFIPDNAATIDHIKSRYDGKRSDPGFKKKTLVLACNKCNWIRSELERASRFTRFDLWRKSNKFPRSKWKVFKGFIEHIWMHIAPF